LEGFLAISEFLIKLKGNSILHKDEQLANLILFSQLCVIHIAVISWIISQIPAIYQSFENLTFGIDFKKLL
jgi:hypothetical protein